jgi:hypothetical protein
MIVMCKKCGGLVFRLKEGLHTAKCPKCGEAVGVRGALEGISFTTRVVAILATVLGIVGIPFAIYMLAAGCPPLPDEAYLWLWTLMNWMAPGPISATVTIGFSTLLAVYGVSFLSDPHRRFLLRMTVLLGIQSLRSLVPFVAAAWVLSGGADRYMRDRGEAVAAAVFVMLGVVLYWAGFILGFIAWRHLRAIVNDAGVSDEDRPTLLNYRPESVAAPSCILTRRANPSTLLNCRPESVAAAHASSTTASLTFRAWYGQRLGCLPVLIQGILWVFLSGYIWIPVWYWASKHTAHREVDQG